MRPIPLLLVAAVACSGSDAPIRKSRPQGPPVTQATLGVFAEDLDAALALAFGDAMPVAAVDRRVPETLMRGRTGTARIAGVRLEERAPARRDLSVALDDYSVSDRLYLTGRVRRHELHGGAGLLRADLQLAGAHGGRVQVHEVLQDGVRTGIVVQVGAAELALGETPPDELVTWVSTLAGDGTEGEGDGPAARARFRRPSGVAVTDDGTVYVADRDAGTIREISPAGEVSTLVRGLNEPYDLDQDGEETLVASLDSALHDDESVLVHVALGGPVRGQITPILGAFEVGCNSIAACDGRSPMASAPFIRGIDAQPGLIMVAQWSLPDSVRAVTPDGYVMTLRQSTGNDCNDEAVPGPRDVAMGPHGETWVLTQHAVRVIDGDHAIRTLTGKQCEIGNARSQLGAPEITRLSHPLGIAYDGERHLYFTSEDHVVRADTVTGLTEPVAGCYPHEPGYDCNSSQGLRDGAGPFAQFHRPDKLALDPHGDLVVADAENHVVRLVRILFDPALDPVVARVEPPTLPRGANATVTLWGANLATTRAVDLGAGVEVEILETWNRAVRLRVKVARDAGEGPRAPRVDTLTGTVTTAEGTALQIIAAPDEPTVETIAGKGDSALDHVPFGASLLSTFGFATGLHAPRGDELLVADPIEHRIRVIATKQRAANQILELLESTFESETAYVVVTGALGLTAEVLEEFGIDDAWKDRARDRILDGVGDAIEAQCKSQGAPDCTWVSLPWAGIPGLPGENDGHRLQATFKLPSDVVGDGSLHYIVDAGNKALRLVGRDEKGLPKDGEVTTPAGTAKYPFAVSMASGGAEAFVTIPASSAVARFTLKDEVMEEAFLGGEAPSCGLIGGEPVGIPLGIARRSGGHVVADPLCRTLRTFELDGGTLRDMRGDLHSWGLGLCADGPLLLAAFGAPLDVAALGDVVFVADAGCHSIRAVFDLLGGLDTDGLKGYMIELLRWQKDRLGEEQVESMIARIESADVGFLDSLRYWVVTIAGSPAGEPGYADGAGSSARFRAPTSVAAVEEDGKRWLFVADTGNHRIRRIRLP